MNEAPKNKPGRRISRTLLIWLASFTLITLAMVIVLFTTDRPPNKSSDILWSLFTGVLGASITVCLLVFTHWLRCWRNVRRLLIGLAVLATLAAIFYTEENWRGKRAWEQCKRDLEAQGAVLDWNKYIPPPVPDDQNFFKAPMMQEWFVKNAPITTNDLSHRLGGFTKYLDDREPVAELTVVPIATRVATGDSDLVLTSNDPKFLDGRDSLSKLIWNTVIQITNGVSGPRLNSSQYSYGRQQPTPTSFTFFFFAQPLNPIKPAHIVLRWNMMPNATNLTQLLGLRVEPVTTNTFHVFPRDFFPPACSAADYLAWSDQFEPDFDRIREALKRPYARMEGDYTQPFQVPIPNFVSVRGVAHTLASRAQCYLLLGQPEKALSEIQLIHDFCRLLEAEPTGKPMTLVAAMINVAVNGLYTSTLAEGFRLQVWQEPQIAALQEQLKEVNLPPLVESAFYFEQVASTHTFETASPEHLADIFSFSSKTKTGLWKRLNDPMYLFFKLAPRGWVYQNIITCAELEQKWTAGLGPDNTLSPQQFEQTYREIDDRLSRFSPFNRLAAIAIPNFSKAWQTTAHNQTLVNEAQIACALERYHLAQGAYPETLDALVPQFIEKLPHDLIGGQPLHYHRTTDGKFLLYSIGWNETDDGGQDLPPNKAGGFDYSQGDWVWKN